MKIKAEYANKKISIGGVDYDFRSLSPERLAKIHENNPLLRCYFEDELTAEEKAFIARIEDAERQSQEAQLKEIGIDTPEQFDRQIKKLAAKPPRKKK